MADSLRSGGRLFLTIDLVKNSNAWNMAEGKIVEDEMNMVLLRVL